MKKIYDDKNDPTKAYLLYANKTEVILMGRVITYQGKGRYIIEGRVG